MTSSIMALQIDPRSPHEGRIFKLFIAGQPIRD
jgi:hypothetical protein